MKKTVFPLLAALAVFAVAAPFTAYAQRRPVVLRIASVAPENTPYGQALNRMRNEWLRITNGEVELRIYPNGTLGGEEDMYRKLRMNEIQGAVFSSFGLNLLTPEILSLSAPFVIRNQAELDYVLENIKGDLAARIEERGFHVIAWAGVGWAKIFSRRPVFVPDDLRRMNTATDPSEMRLLQAFKTLGYQMVPLGQTDLLVGLTGGMVDAFYTSPIQAAAMQLFAAAPNMAGINIAPVMGGIVLSSRAWQQVPAQYRDALARVNRQIEQSMATSVLQLEETAMRAMLQNGLTVNQLSPQQEQVWYDDTARAMPNLLGSTFDRATTERITTLLQQYRARNPSR